MVTIRSNVFNLYLNRRKSGSFFPIFRQFCSDDIQMLYKRDIKIVIYLQQTAQ